MMLTGFMAMVRVVACCKVVVKIDVSTGDMFLYSSKLEFVVYMSHTLSFEWRPSAYLL